ncbi:MAG TPA: TonB-dependent receptor [Gemmatimonadales bacterium]|nr:TonB-dependent receptor [Gemmatimonadales bacterium]
MTVGDGVRRAARAAAVAAAVALAGWARPAAAQVNGAITGQVTDAMTGRGVAGAQVRILGSAQGALTDSGGRYRLREMHPGTWTVLVIRIGYRQVRRDDVVVNAGEVLRLDLAMAPVAVQVESLVVRQERDPILDPLAPAATQRITAKDFRNLPISTVEDAIGLSAGTVDQSVRGGRPGEQAFVLDGVGVKNQLDASTNGPGFRIPPDLLQEASLVSNGFSARYGQAISGLINVTTRDGGDRWSGRAAYETDRPAPTSWDYGLDRVVVSAGGPLPGGARMMGALDLTGRLDAEPVSAPLPGDPRDLRHDSPLLPFNGGETYTGALKLALPVAGHDVRLFALHTLEQRQLFDYVYKYEGRWSPVRRVSGTLLTAQVQHTFGAGTVDPMVLDARIGFLDRDFLRGQSRDPADQAFGAFTFKPLHIVGEELARAQDTAAAQGQVPGMLSPDFSTRTPYGVPAFFYGQGGRGEVSWNHYREARLQLDFTKGLGQGADLLFGTDVARQHVQTFQRVLGYLPAGYGDSVPPPVASDFSPLALGAYVEGQQRFGDLAITAGLRFDRFDPGTGSLAGVKARTALGPRVSFSTVLNGATVVVSWGRFAQAPDYQYLVDAAFDDTTRTGRFRTGNPDLGYETATQYEFSVRTRPSPVTNLRVNVYVKLLDGLVASVPVAVSPDSAVFANADYGRVYGAEVLFEREVFKGFRARLNGTLQSAQASASDAFRQRVTVVDPVSGDTITASRDQFPLDYDRRLSFIGALEYETPGTLPSPVAGLSLAAIGRYASGLPFSRTNATGDTIIGPPNSQRLPAQQTLDLLVRRPVTLGGRHGSVYLDVRNALNRRNIVAVRRDTGSPYLDEASLEDRAMNAYLAHPEAIPYESPRYRSYADLDHDGLIAGQDELYPLFLAAARDAFQPTFAYGAPRLVRLGVELEF